MTKNNEIFFRNWSKVFWKWLQVNLLRGRLRSEYPTCRVQRQREDRQEFPVNSPLYGYPVFRRFPLCNQYYPHLQSKSINVRIGKVEFKRTFRFTRKFSPTPLSYLFHQFLKQKSDWIFLFFTINGRGFRCGSRKEPNTLFSLKKFQIFYTSFIFSWWRN